MTTRRTVLQRHYSRRRARCMEASVDSDPATGSRPEVGLLGEVPSF